MPRQASRPAHATAFCCSLGLYRKGRTLTSPGSTRGRRAEERAAAIETDNRILEGELLFAAARWRVDCAGVACRPGLVGAARNHLRRASSREQSLIRMTRMGESGPEAAVRAQTQIVRLADTGRQPLAHWKQSPGARPGFCFQEKSPLTRDWSHHDHERSRVLGRPDEADDR